jgi:hypothetical protein
MRIPNWCVLPLFIVSLAAEQLPTLEGENLLGKSITLPAASANHIAILVIGFTHASQTQTKAWSQRLHEQFPASSQEQVYSIAVLQDVPKLVRGMAVHGIKSGTPAEQRDRFILLFHKEAELKQTAGFAAPDDAYLILLDQGGAIRWRFHGALSDDAVQQILAQVRALEQSGAR